MNTGIRGAEAPLVVTREMHWVPFGVLRYGEARISHQAPAATEMWSYWMWPEGDALDPADSVVMGTTGSVVATSQSRMTRREWIAWFRAPGDITALRSGLNGFLHIYPP